jgi:hypothetical protein
LEAWGGDAAGFELVAVVALFVSSVAFVILEEEC